MKPHVLFLTYHLPMGSEPGAFRPWMEARLLAQAGFRVTVITSGVQYMTGEDIRLQRGWCTEEWVEDIRILRTWAPSDYRRRLWKRLINYFCFTLLSALASFLRVGKIDRLLAGTEPIFMAPMVYLVSHLKRVSVVLDERDLFPEAAIDFKIIKEGVLSRLWLAMLQLLRSRALAILAATPGIKAKLIAYGCPESKVFLLYNADPFLEEDLGVQNVMSLREMTGKKFLVGYTGGLGRTNDVATLLKAGKRIIDLHHVGIIIIGAGERSDFYKEYCQRHGLHNVFLLGAAPRSETRQFLGQMDVCVQPLPAQPYSDLTLTSKTFDYHGLWKPMIFCGTGDTENLLRKSGGGITVPPEDDKALAEAIRWFSQNDSLRVTMGASARQWFEQKITTEAACTIIKKAMGV